MQNIGVSIGGLLMGFLFWFVIPTVTFCVARVLFSMAYGFGKLINNTSSNEKAFTISRWIGVIAFHIPVLFHPAALTSEIFFGRPMMPDHLHGWFGGPLSIPFFLLGWIAACLGGAYSPREYDFWKCMYRLR